MQVTVDEFTYEEVTGDCPGVLIHLHSNDKRIDISLDAIKDNIKWFGFSVGMPSSYDTSGVSIKSDGLVLTFCLDNVKYQVCLHQYAYTIFKIAKCLGDQDNKITKRLYLDSINQV